MAALATSRLMFLFFSLLSSSINAQSHNNITLNDYLTAVDGSSPWLSPSGDFAFGFRRIEGKDGFLLAIWFNKIPDRTIVWSASGDAPAPRGSRIQLTDSGFVLIDPQGREISKPILIGIQGVSYAAMLDSGNLVILSNNSAGYAWESFKNPTDTLLPKQTLEKFGIVSGRLTETNYTKGRFELRMLDDGNLVLNTKGWPTDVRYNAYYISNTFGEGMRLVFDESGYIYVEKSDGSRFDINSQRLDPITNFYYRARLDFDGVFTLYSHPKASNGNQTWSTVWSIPDDICVAIFDDLGSGACGFNSYCTLTSENRPRCECPPDYSLIDPANTFGGCKPNFRLGCEDGSRDPNDVFKLEEVKDVDWPTGDYEKLALSSEECRRSCLSDCFCAVAVFREFCWKKKLPLSNGRRGASGDPRVLIKVRRNNDQ